jgi:hypothetical protein
MRNITCALLLLPAVTGTAAPSPRAIFELVKGSEASELTAAGESTELAKASQPAYIVVAKTEHKGVLAAAKDLQRDITKIAGVTPNIVHSLQSATEKCIVIGTADCAEGRALLASVGVPVEDVAGKWEVFKYRVLNATGGKKQILAIAGSNARGTIFGVYDFEQKHLGVDPLWFWADHEPATRGELVFDDRINFGPTNEPTWKYRGWTLNDHPQLLEWMQSGIVQRTRYARYMFALHPEVIARFCEAALRLKMNMFTWYFIDIDWQPDRDGLQSVVDRGLFITQQQMEGVGADVGFWDSYWKSYNPAGKPPMLSYRKYPEAFREFWSHYIKQWAEFSPQVVWEINQRGWADAQYTEPTLPQGGTPQQRARVISDALADQARLVRELDPNPDLQMMTTLYAELGTAYDEGWLKVPSGVTTGFADRGMNGMSYSRAFWTEKRDPARKYGQYFHTQYFGGGPQIAKCTPIDTYLKINIDAMYQRGDTQQMLLAINELRLQQLEIRGVAEMLWDYPAFQARDYLQRYAREEFGADAGPRVTALYDLYYENFPHRTNKDEFKTYSSYYKVMEPMFTVIGNLLSIENGTSDGKALKYDYKRDIYEKGIVSMGEVLRAARELRPSIPADRHSFFDYEFIAPSQIVRGIYKLSIATQEAIARLQKNDRAGALAALLDARPLTEELYAAFKSETAGEKWRYWFRSSTNKDFYLLYNLFQKARLRLEVDTMNAVAVMEPQRRPFLGNVVMHDPAKVGDAIYGSQPERINASVFNGSRWSLTKFPLEGAFQIGGVDTVSGKGEWLELTPTDHGHAYAFSLRGRSTVYVAIEKGHPLPWLTEQGFRSTGQTLEAGFWGRPYRYQNRPPGLVKTFEIFAREFPAGAVRLGENAASKKRLPYLVFVKPVTLLYENFRHDAFGQAPAAWTVATEGAAVVDIPDYDAEMRPTC